MTEPIIGLYRSFSKAPAYRGVAARYRLPGLTRSGIEFLPISTTPANYAGADIVVQRLNANGSLTSQTYRFRNGGSPPAPPIIDVNVTGLSTVSAFAGAIGSAFVANGWLATIVLPAGRVLIYQPTLGAAGNTTVIMPTSLNTRVNVNGLTNFDANFPKFYNGATATPVRFGRNFGMLATSQQTAQTVPYGG